MSRTRIQTLFLTALWLMAAAFAYTKMLSFDSTPGRSAAQAPQKWPVQPGLAPAADRPTLIVFLHPKCTCSRASVTQIARLQQEFPNRFHTVLAVWQPLHGDSSWGNLPTPESGHLNDYQLIWDRGGQLASRFDAHTSGQSLFYDPSGRLRFAGGLTSSRGNSTDGPAFSSLEKVIRGANAPSAMPVFGCEL